MKSVKSHIVILLFLLVFTGGCGSAKYIHDEGSKSRQTELIKHRSGNVFSGIGKTFISIIFSSAFDTDVMIYPDDKEFKKLKLKNTTNDILYVNMLTDVYWDENNYCDFMDIRIPPHKKYKILVPVDAYYNIYFSNTPEPDDDEMIEIYTGDLKKIDLYPGLTNTFETIN